MCATDANINHLFLRRRELSSAPHQCTLHWGDSCLFMQFSSAFTNGKQINRAKMVGKTLPSVPHFVSTLTFQPPQVVIQQCCTLPFFNVTIFEGQSLVN